MEKRVYGVLGIVSIMANWNADFTGYPKTISDGTVFGSDKAFKYPMKKMWENEGRKVIYIKSFKLAKEKDKVTLTPNSLKERYEQVFGVKNLKDCKDSSEVLKNLFQAVDVKNFGATFAEEGNNISITGAVQFGQGLNKYEDSDAEEQQILSPFRDAKAKAAKSKNAEEAEEAKNSTLGTKIVSNEAHYFYPFSITPAAYNGYVELGVTDGYTEEDYALFKKTSLVSATSYSTNAKAGCDNEFGLFIETESDLYLPNLAQYMTFEKGEEKNTIKVMPGEIVNPLSEKIKMIEIYYNPLTTNIETDLENVRMYNIFTQKEV